MNIVQYFILPHCDFCLTWFLIQVMAVFSTCSWHSGHVDELLVGILLDAAAEPFT